MLKDKALTSLAVGDLLMERGFPDDAASRYYYAMYRAAVHALTANGFRPEQVRSGALEWDHSMVENNAGSLRQHPADRRLYRDMRALRVLADYADASVSREQLAARRASITAFVKALTA